jgi:ABC-type glycerol-3-phosphate transport system substrate-binding protein
VVAGWFEMQTAIIAALQKVLVKQATPQQAADEAAAKIKIIIAENK